MKRTYLNMKKIGVLLSIGLLALTTYFLWESDVIGSHPVDFNAEIRPILNKKCITCHGGVKRSGEFSLLFRSEALGVNESGKRAIVPGSVDESEMIHRITHDDPEVRMPPEGDPLTQEEINLLTQWIEEGAKWEDHWAYIKPEPIEPPETQAEWGDNQIDQFILNRLEEENLQPSSPADKATLLRRLSLDLTGLPPTEEELDHFLANTSADAYEEEVDRLLASPRYGERWASMWMDLARYADSKGYEADRGRSIWQYRDWLIKAFNDDKPFDEFTIEQLAGDLLLKPTDEQLIATAFHRNTMNNDEGGTDDEEFRVAAVIDRVNTSWDVWQATTMACVQCHSHPYDPIRHEDYYKSYAFFNNTADEDVASESPNLKTFKQEADRQSLEQVKNWVIEHTASADVKLEKAQQFVNLVKVSEPKIHGHSFDKIQKGTLDGYKRLTIEDGGHNRVPDVPLSGADQILFHYSAGSSKPQVEIRLDSLEGRLLTRWNMQNTEGFQTVAVPIPATEGRHDLYLKFKSPGQKGYLCTIEWILLNEALPGENQAGYEQVNQQLFHLINSPEVIETPVMIEKADGYRRKTYVFERGNWMVHGEEVQPGLPQAWNAMPDGAPQNRLGFARWLVSKDNPLTARVTVNRFWAQLFGTGIVETIEDFGTQGFATSHPELLDWLAQQFMYEHAWSIKKLLKQMVMSAAYRQSSKASQKLLAVDPDNRLLARGPRVRLNAEQVRDQALAVSGLLSDKMYGPSVMPPQPEGIWQVVYNGMSWETSEGEDKYRRALYTYWRRTSPYPSMIAFDGPSREFCVTRRIDTNTPLQALVTLNDPVYMEAAHGLAQRMQEAEHLEGQLKRGYKLAMLKEIEAEKLQDLQKLYHETRLQLEAQPEAVKQVAGEDNVELAVLTVVANVILNLDEFITKS
ncbi:hypothetical protein OKW21_001671 [Catalinimonas alkaloidigena]|uniref:DUF1553 domain-containing protein n=1 Tax=Catalinimonas alkaloidigena TaxID=1075417 RepID=UPI002405325D|nr:DUF1553 domain-containing protein [Catalinimonas alkaloidigena]MDF9796408.1 hypothetical protein [Catalinimonas alkaloidigena]